VSKIRMVCERLIASNVKVAYFKIGSHPDISVEILRKPLPQQPRTENFSLDLTNTNQDGCKIIATRRI
jgi:hypothetical protein